MLQDRVRICPTDRDQSVNGTFNGEFSEIGRKNFRLTDHVTELVEGQAVGSSLPDVADVIVPKTGFIVFTVDGEFIFDLPRLTGEGLNPDGEYSIPSHGISRFYRSVVEKFEIV